MNTAKRPQQRRYPHHERSAPTRAQLRQWLREFDQLALSDIDRAEIRALASACPDLSERNCALLWLQMRRRSIPVGPVRGWSAWKTMGCHIARGNHALYILVPCHPRIPRDEEAEEASESPQDEADTTQLVRFKPFPLFALAQTAASDDIIVDAETAALSWMDDLVDEAEPIYQCWECGRLIGEEMAVAIGLVTVCMECAERFD